MQSSSILSEDVVPPAVTQRIKEIQDDGKRVVVTTCGLAGSGKSTFSHALTAHYSTFNRLSIDTIIFTLHGTYLTDYSLSQLSAYQAEAETILNSNLTSLLNQAEKDIVLDLSFYSREWRDEMREIVERKGKGKYEVLLVVFRGEEEVLWRRIEGRNELFGEGKEEREGMRVERDMLKGWMDGFEWPDGEGEIVIDVT